MAAERPPAYHEIHGLPPQLPADVNDWSEEDVSSWVRSLGKAAAWARLADKLLQVCCNICDVNLHCCLVSQLISVTSLRFDEYSRISAAPPPAKRCLSHVRMRRSSQFRLPRGCAVAALCRYFVLPCQRDVLLLLFTLPGQFLAACGQIGRGCSAEEVSECLWWVDGFV